MQALHSLCPHGVCCGAERTLVQYTHVYLESKSWKEGGGKKSDIRLTDMDMDMSDAGPGFDTYKHVYYGCSA